MSVELHVFVRPPQRGRVKTRLQADAGAAATLQIYRWLLRHTLGQAAQSAIPTTVWSAESPWHPRLRQWALDQGFSLRTQPPGDLGQRMQFALESSLRKGRKALIIGSDCPAIDARYLADAAQRLRQKELIIGPANDGGYVMLGLQRPAPGLFRQIHWSAPSVLRTTLRRASLLGLDPLLLPALDDIDRLTDWKRWTAGQGEIPTKY